MPVLIAPAAVLVIVALLALLLLLAWQQMANAISALVPSWHIPGFGSLRGWITDHIADAYHATAGYLDKYVKPLTTMVVAPVLMLTSMFNELGALDHAMYNFGVNIARVTIPRAVAILRSEATALEGRARLYAHQLWLDATAYTRAEVGLAEAQAVTLYHDARGFAAALYNESVAFTRAEVGLAEAQAVTLYHDARGFAAALYNESVAFTRAGIAAAEADAALLFRTAQATIELRYRAAIAHADQVAVAAATSAIAGVTGALVTDLDQLWPAVTGVIDDVTDVAAGAFTDVIDDLRGLTRDVPASLPAAIATSLAVAIPLLRLAKDCTIPNCRNLSQVGRDLQALFGAVEGGALLALVGAAAHDPEGVADVLVDGLGPVLRVAADQAERMVGAA